MESDFEFQVRKALTCRELVGVRRLSTLSSDPRFASSAKGSWFVMALDPEKGLCHDTRSADELRLRFAVAREKLRILVSTVGTDRVDNRGFHDVVAKMLRIRCVAFVKPGYLSDRFLEILARESSAFVWFLHRLGFFPTYDHIYDLIITVDVTIGIGRNGPHPEAILAMVLIALQRLEDCADDDQRKHEQHQLIVFLHHMVRSWYLGSRVLSFDYKTRWKDGISKTVEILSRLKIGIESDSLLARNGVVNEEFWVECVCRVTAEYE